MPPQDYVPHAKAFGNYMQICLSVGLSPIMYIICAPARGHVFSCHSTEMFFSHKCVLVSYIVPLKLWRTSYAPANYECSYPVLAFNYIQPNIAKGWDTTAKICYTLYFMNIFIVREYTSLNFYMDSVYNYYCTSCNFYAAILHNYDYIHNQ